MINQINIKRIVIILIAVIIVGIGSGIYLWQKSNKPSSDFIAYSNIRYGFSVKYPADWHKTGGPQSEIIQFSSIKEESGDGGISLGARIEILILENYKSLSLEEWVEKNELQGLPREILKQEEITVGSKKAIKEINNPLIVGILPDNIEEGQPISVYLYSQDAHIIQINYLGQEPDYSENIKYFEHLLKSFKEDIIIWRDWDLIKSEEECLSLDGEWEMWSSWQTEPACNMPYPDGGKACRDSKDCVSQKCLFLEEKPTLKGIVEGECAEWINVGCVNHHYYIEKGVIIEKICLE